MSLNDQKILIVDDDPVVLKSLQDLLSFLGFSPDVAIGGQEAIVFLDQNSYDLVLLDLPDSEEQLAELLASTQPQRIYAHFYAKESQYFEQIPTREQFAWLFSFIKKRGSFDFKKHCDELAKHKGWTRETLFFMLQVFFELEFVTLNNGLTEIAKAPSKRDLTEAPIYKKRQQQIALEQKLLYASYKDLKQWFDAKVSAKEEEIWI